MRNKIGGILRQDARTVDNAFANWVATGVFDNIGDTPEQFLPLIFRDKRQILV